MQTWIRNRYSVLPIWIFIIWMCVYIYLCIYIHLKINKLVYYISYNNDGNNAWVWDSWTVNAEKSKHAAGKKKKKKERNANLDPNGYSVLPIWIFIIWMCVCIYIYVYIHLKFNKLVYYISYNNDGNNAWVWDPWTVHEYTVYCWKVKICCWEKKKKKGKEMQTWICTAGKKKKGERNANLDL